MKLDKVIEKYQKIPVDEFQNKVHKKPVVSVCVQTYQHAQYIEKCLDGILIQKLNSPIEILVGEDASRDRTRDICREYALKYPDKIRLFLHHRENNIQVAGIPTGRFNLLYNFYKARGRYIALCDGDDYWTDPDKLQKQIDFLEAYKEYSVSFHAVTKHYNDHSVQNSLFVPRPPVNGSAFRIEDVIIQGGSMMPTSSMIFPIKQLDSFPEWAISAPVADTPLALVLANQGRLHYTNEIMGAYRINSTGSWSEKMQDSKLQKLKVRGMLNMWDQFDEWTDGKFHNLISVTKRKMKYRYYKFRVKKYLRGVYDTLVGNG